MSEDKRVPDYAAADERHRARTLNAVADLLEALPIATLKEQALIDAAIEWHEMRFASVALRMTVERKMIAAIIAVQRQRGADTTSPTAGGEG